MSKFLSFFLSVILVIFFIIPTSAYAASNSYGSYTYFIQLGTNGVAGQSAVGYTGGTYDQPLLKFYEALKGNSSNNVNIDVTIHSLISYFVSFHYWDDTGTNHVYSNPHSIQASFVALKTLYSSVTNFSLPPLTLHYDDPMHTLEHDISTISVGFQFDDYKDADFYGYRYHGDVMYSFVISTSFPLDLSHLEDVVSVHLIDISGKLDSINNSINLVLSAINSNFTGIDNRLLQILDALNRIPSSGGGTAAIVGAINSATGQINKVLAQQQVSSDSIVGAIGSQTVSINAALGLVQSAVSGVTEELKRQAQANLDSVQSDGNKVTGMASDLLDQVNDKWSALTVPIDFTKKIFEVFTNGTRSASYRRVYGHISGYRYDSTTGGLEPIYTAKERSIGGTVITFPAFDFTLPGVGTLHVWDSYDFDLSQLKKDFPMIFDAIYVIAGILMIYWIVDFIIHLGDDLLDI